jgi:hypothetical protein
MVAALSDTSCGTVARSWQYDRAASGCKLSHSYITQALSVLCSVIVYSSNAYCNDLAVKT